MTKIFLIANIIFAAALAISYLATVINPDVFAFPALFGLAYPYLLLVNLIFVLAWAAALRLEALISAVVIAVGITQFSNYIKLSKPSGDKTGTFKVLSYNIRLFNYFEGRRTPNSEKRILDLLTRQQADIVCLQEVYFPEAADQEKTQIESTLRGKYFSHIKLIHAGKSRYYGIITLSRFPIIRRGDIVHPESSSLSIYTDVVVGDDTIRIFNNQLQSFRLQRMERHFLNEIADAYDNKETLKKIKNISMSLKNGFARRALQAEALKEKVITSPYPVIVAGDFNDTPVSYSYRKIKKGLNDSFITSGYGAGFTYRGNYPPNRIDYILYDKKIECRQFEILKVRYSDHYPIIAYFKKPD